MMEQRSYVLPRPMLLSEPDKAKWKPADLSVVCLRHTVVIPCGWAELAVNGWVGLQQRAHFSGYVSCYNMV